MVLHQIMPSFFGRCYISFWMASTTLNLIRILPNQTITRFKRTHHKFSSIKVAGRIFCTAITRILNLFPNVSNLFYFFFIMFFRSYDCLKIKSWFIIFPSDVNTKYDWPKRRAGEKDPTTILYQMLWASNCW